MGILSGRVLNPPRFGFGDLTVEKAKYAKTKSSSELSVFAPLREECPSPRKNHFIEVRINNGYIINYGHGSAEA
jgi:hypothetical protein